MKVIKIENGSLKIIKGMEENDNKITKKKLSANPYSIFTYKTSKFQTLKVSLTYQVFLTYWKNVGYFYLIILFLLYCVSGILHVALIYFLTE